MARQLAKLSSRRVATVTTPGKHSDGGGLYLVVDPSGAKRWMFLFRWRAPGEAAPGRLREMGLGSFQSVPLEAARRRAQQARELVAEGIDPIAARKAQREVPTFGQMADEFVRMRTRQIDSDKSVARLHRALEVYALGLRPLRVDAVTTDQVLKTLLAPPPDEPGGTPFWHRVPASASTTRSYIEAVLDAAKARGFREGENPARWRGHLDKLLSKPKKLTRGHHKAMPYDQVPAFLKDLGTVGSSAALGLEFLILTGLRSKPVCEARWSEVDWKAALWIIPGPKMKMKTEHRVPLSDRAMSVLKLAKDLGSEDFIFPGAKASSPLSNMGFSMLLRRRKLAFTTHGFRSSFRDWAGEETDFSREVAELAMAHSIGDVAERAYRRGDALEKRRALMQAWADYCSGISADVVSLRARRRPRS